MRSTPHWQLSAQHTWMSEITKASGLLIITGLALLLAAGPGNAQDLEPGKVQFSSNNDGIKLKWRDLEPIANPKPSAKRVVLETQKVNPENDLRNFSFSQVPLKKTSAKFDRNKRQYITKYDWGQLRTRYSLEKDVLRIRLSAHNSTDKPVANFRFRILQVRLPNKPKKLQKGKVRSTRDQPVAIGFKAGTGKMYASYESFAPPVKFGFAKPEKGQNGIYSLVVGGGIHVLPRDGMVVPPKGLPRIPPGETLELEFALRFAGQDTNRAWALRGFFDDYHNFLSPMLDWPDRRPIGAVYMMAEWGKIGTQFGTEMTNPRRLASPLLDTTDVFSPHGKDLLRRNLQAMARSTVEALKEMNAQGAILWNPTVGFHGFHFSGDPRMVPILTPELDEPLDDYFRIIREAGFRVGVTIRHPQLQWRGDRWAQGIGNINPKGDPLKKNYERFIPEHTRWWTVYPIARRLSAKIAYAKKRWGCTLFYYDTSTIRRFHRTGNGQNMVTSPPRAHIYRKLREEHPDVIIFPELRDRIAPAAYTAPYGQTGYGRIRPTYKGDYTRDIIPNYFGFNYIHDSGGDPWKPRLNRINEIVWGEILATDGWSIGGKQRSIRVHYNHANDKLRRATTMAKQFGVLDTEREHLPLPYAIRNATRIRSSNIVANPPAHPQLRTYAAVGENKREGLLMLAWYGWPYSRGTTLKSSLPGLDLNGEHFDVWDIETGELLNTKKGIKVPGAPVTMFRALYVRATDNPTPPARTKGVAMRASFNKGLAPDHGGGLLTNNGNANRADGHSGAALQINGDGVARYGVVPSWYSGTVEFDLRVQSLDDNPLTLVRLRHHLNTTLKLVSRAGQPALRLQTLEWRAAKDYWKDTQLSPVEDEGYTTRKTTVALPKKNEWQRIVLAWELGQYKVYVNGERKGVITSPVMTRWRDGTVLKPGLILGMDTKTPLNAKAQVDSLNLYDWCFRDQDAQNRTPRTGFAALPKPADQKPTVWLWGNGPKKLRMAVNARRCSNGERSKSFKATLYRKNDDELLELSSGNTQPYRGVRTILMEYEPKANVNATDAMVNEEGDSDDLAGDLDNLIQDYVLKIKVAAHGKNPPDRKEVFRFDSKKKTWRHW